MKQGTVNNVFPLITKPTTVTSATATLIDHFLTNNFVDAMMHIQGILCTSISDRHAVSIACNSKTDNAKTDMPLLKRNMGQMNITKFIFEINIVDCHFVLTETDN